MSLSDFSQLAPDVIISCRDEHWLVSNVALTADGFRIRARGVSDYVRDTTATFFIALDDIGFSTRPMSRWPRVSLRFLAYSLVVGVDAAPHAGAALYQKQVEVATQKLADPLDYQLSAVKLALSDERL